MVILKHTEGSAPTYQSLASAGADLKSSVTVILPKSSTVAVNTGVWIETIMWEQVPKGLIPELQIRARSGLALNHGITLANGVGTVDADYKDEIKVLLWNTSKEDFTINVGDRIAQLLLGLSHRIPTLPVLNNVRKGGFGSTGITT